MIESETQRYEKNQFVSESCMVGKCGRYSRGKQRSEQGCISMSWCALRAAAGINQLCPHPFILTHCIHLDLFLLLAASTLSPGAFWYVGTFSGTRHLAPLVTRWRRGERERGSVGTVGGWDGLKCRRGENRGGELAFLQRSARFPSLWIPFFVAVYWEFHFQPGYLHLAAKQMCG